MTLIANIHDDISFELAKAIEDRQGTATELFEKMYVPRMVQGNVQLQFYTIGGDAPRFCGDNDLTRGTYRRLDAMWEALAGRDDFVVVQSGADLEPVKRGEKRGLVVTMEGALPVGDDGFFNLHNFYRIGMRSITLFWFKANQTGDGINEDRQCGLTNYGKQLVKEMNRLGMLIDVSQGTPQTFWDIIELSTAPVVASHSNASGYHQHKRNLTDDQVKAIAGGGGLVGVSTYTAHVGASNPTLDDLIRHIDYIVNLVGPDYVCFGLNILPGDLADNRQFFAGANIEFTSLYLPGLEDITKLPDAVERLEKLGYSKETVDKIAWGNVIRVLEQVLR
jgi:membrane dipeptidase